MTLKERVHFLRDTLPHPWNTSIQLCSNSIHVDWGGPDKDWWYFLISYNTLKHWTYMDKNWSTRRWGIEKYWYDGPHVQLCLYFFSVAWSTYWTNEDFFLKRNDNGGKTNAQ